MTRPEILKRIEAVFVCGFSTREQFREETGHAFTSIPDPVPDIVDRWQAVRWGPRHRYRLLQAMITIRPAQKKRIIILSHATKQ